MPELRLLEDYLTAKIRVMTLCFKAISESLQHSCKKQLFKVVVFVIIVIVIRCYLISSYLPWNLFQTPE
jgi:hypothetical protein